MGVRGPGVAVHRGDAAGVGRLGRQAGGLGRQAGEGGLSGRGGDLVTLVGGGLGERRLGEGRAGGLGRARVGWDGAGGVRVDGAGRLGRARVGWDGAGGVRVDGTGRLGREGRSGAGLLALVGGREGHERDDGLGRERHERDGGLRVGRDRAGGLGGGGGVD